MEREELTDLAIIGGGPAGTAAALEARRHGLGVVVWERDRFPRDKVCGEFVSAEALPLLEQEIPATVARGAPIGGAEFISRDGRAWAFPLPRPARGLSRRALDEALWRAAAASGTEMREAVAVRALRKLPCNHEGTWQLESSTGIVRRARAVIIACGRWWALEGFPSPARNGSKNGAGAWLGAKAHFRGIARRDAVEMYFFPGGYCGLAPIEDGLYNACCLVHRSLARDTSAGGLGDFAAWLKTVARHPALEARLQGRTQVTETVSTAPVVAARRSAEHEGALMAGDAAGFLDPFTGDGISMALHSGRLAAEELARARSGEPPALDGRVRSYRQRLGRAVRRSYVVAGVLRSLVRAPAGVQASAAAALVPRLGGRLLAATRWHAS